MIAIVYRIMGWRSILLLESESADFLNWLMERIGKLLRRMIFRSFDDVLEILHRNTFGSDNDKTDNRSEDIEGGMCDRRIGDRRSQRHTENSKERLAYEVMVRSNAPGSRHKERHTRNDPQKERADNSDGDDLRFWKCIKPGKHAEDVEDPNSQ